MTIQKTAEFHILTNLTMSNKDLLALVLRDHKDAKTTVKSIMNTIIEIIARTKR